MPNDRVLSFHKEIVSASSVATDPLACPRCKSRELLLKGDLCFPHEETRSGEEIVHAETEYDIEAPFVLKEYTCLSCHYTFDIRSDRECTLSKELSDAREEIRKQSGKGSQLC